ncbi:MAG: hypothetical protein HYR64_04960 [Fimbriimonas ginsengisoli]|uniref:Uncharacterized protein n=1 Tax=Fimbriimonas ginsengisoli TaxID=1005039 RepID=A0A931LV58_FIMGI|nr:hypothetical protein [Fimbriimonas ginsengisoli]
MKRFRFVLPTSLVVFALVGASLVFAWQGDMKMKDMRSAAGKKAAAGVAKEKARQVKKGMYGCCLKHSCDFCAMHMGNCECGEMATMDQPVCNECKGGWAAGDGRIAGKSADAIKTMPRGMKM